MVTISPASIVVIPFPFSDLSGSKLRPAVVLAETGQGDWLLCQITSRPTTDPTAIRLTQAQLSSGNLIAESFARPLKLFTANADLILKRVAVLNDAAFRSVLLQTIVSLQRNLPPEPATSRP